jgi:Xaa-Pro aminopeptidase
MIKMPVTLYTSRLARIREAINKKKKDGFLVTDLTNVRYLTSFSGSSGLLIISKKENIFITDFRYKEQAEKEVKGWDIVIERGNRIDTIQDISQKTGIRKLGFESSVSYAFYEKLSHCGFHLNVLEGFIEKFRLIKSVHEINSIKEAVRRAEAAFLDVKPYIKQGVKERTIALRLEERLKKNGCRHIPFDIIVASGCRSAMPHAMPTEKKLSKGDLVIIDWGGEANGYFSDMTRTFLLRGDRNAGKKREIYRIVLEANNKAVSSIYPGIESKNIDNAARSFIRKAGYADFFGHGTGHGVGLQVHESPRITWNKSEILREGMVFTVEPGIYVPGLGGVRIEDMVVVGKKKAVILNSLPKKLLY